MKKKEQNNLTINQDAFNAMKEHMIYQVSNEKKKFTFYKADLNDSINHKLKYPLDEHHLNTKTTHIHFFLYIFVIYFCFCEL